MGAEAMADADVTSRPPDRTHSQIASSGSGVTT
jgi:hypothetical protein